MTERPILLSAQDVRGILEGRKTQLRRIVKHRISPEWWAYRRKGAWNVYDTELCQDVEIRSPYGEPGDRLWVKEAFFETAFPHYPTIAATMIERGDSKGRISALPEYRVDKWAVVHYRADDDYKDHTAWKPSIHMPRWASRLTLEITDLRVQRVQEITEEDAIAEGVKTPSAPCGDCNCIETANQHRCHFSLLWDSQKAKSGYFWESNPFVWALTVRRIETA